MTIELERATDMTVLLQSEANCYWGMGGGGEVQARGVYVHAEIQDFVMHFMY